MDAAFLQLERNAVKAGRAAAGRHVQETVLRSRRHHQQHGSPAPDSWNALKSRIHCILTQWDPGFHDVLQLADRHDQHKLTGEYGAGGADVTGLNSALVRRPAGG
jgi:hypothetical protein